MSTTKKQATQPECPNHNVARLFCMTCYVVFCRNCALKRHPKPSHVHIELPQSNSTERDFEFLGKILEELLKRQTNISDVNDQLWNSVEMAKQEVRNTAGELRAKVTILENEIVEKIESTHKDRKNELKKTYKTLGTLSESMHKSLETAKTVDNSALDRDSFCSTVIRDLEQLSGQHKINVDNTAELIFKKHEIADGDIKLGKVLWTRTTGGWWELSREFGKKGSNPGEFGLAYGIALRGSHLAVGDYRNDRVVICSMYGKQSCNIPLKGPRSFAVSQPGNRLVVVCPSNVKVCNADNSEVFTFYDRFIERDQ